MSLDSFQVKHEKRKEICTLRCLINVRRTFINFKDFSHQYLLIRDRTFIKFESIITQTKIIVLFCKSYSGFRVWLMVFSAQYFYFDPYIYCFFKIFYPVRLLGPVHLLGTLELVIFEWSLGKSHPKIVFLYHVFSTTRET